MLNVIKLGCVISQCYILALLGIYIYATCFKIIGVMWENAITCIEIMYEINNNFVPVVKMLLLGELQVISTTTLT